VFLLRGTQQLNVGWLLEAARFRGRGSTKRYPFVEQQALLQCRGGGVTAVLSQQPGFCSIHNHRRCASSSQSHRPVPQVKRYRGTSTKAVWMISGVPHSEGGGSESAFVLNPVELWLADRTMYLLTISTLCSASRRLALTVRQAFPRVLKFKPQRSFAQTRFPANSRCAFWMPHRK